VDFGGGLHDPLEVASLALEEFEPLEDAVVAARLERVYAVLDEPMEVLDHLFGGEVLGHLAAEFGGEVGVADERVAAADEASDVGIAEGHFGKLRHRETLFPVAELGRSPRAGACLREAYLP